MSKLKKAKELPSAPLNPDLFYRMGVAGPYFGYKPTQLKEKIDAGEIPKPTNLSDTGRACGWFGRVILKWQAEREADSQRGVAA